ncbi:MAG: hypothetical protein ACYTE8_08280, partial [Planctomycetota bacterium]
MLVFRKIKFVCLYVLIPLLCSGCFFIHETPESPTSLMPLAHTENNSAALKRFQEPAPEGPTPVETAIEISEKYAKLTQEASMLRQENSQLIKQNIELDT